MRTFRDMVLPHKLCKYLSIKFHFNVKYNVFCSQFIFYLSL